MSAVTKGLVELDFKKTQKTLASCLSKLEGIIAPFLKNGLLIQIATKFHSEGLISLPTKENPTCEKIIRELKGGVECMTTLEELEKRRQSIMAVLEGEDSGPLQDAVKKFEMLCAQKLCEKSSIQESRPTQVPFRFEISRQIGGLQKNEKEQLHEDILRKLADNTVDKNYNLLSIMPEHKVKSGESGFAYEEGKEVSTTDTLGGSKWEIKTSETVQQPVVSDISYGLYHSSDIGQPVNLPQTDNVHPSDFLSPGATAELQNISHENQLTVSTEGHTRTLSNSTITQDEDADEARPLRRSSSGSFANESSALLRGAERRHSSISTQGSSRRESTVKPPDFPSSRSYDRLNSRSNSSIPISQEGQAEYGDRNQLVTATSDRYTLGSDQSCLQLEIQHYKSVIRDKDKQICELKEEQKSEREKYERALKIERDDRLEEIKQERDRHIQVIKENMHIMLWKFFILHLVFLIIIYPLLMVFVKFV